VTRPRPAAVLAGASGLVGGHLLKELLRARKADGGPAYREVVILTRRPLGLEREAGEVPPPGGGSSSTVAHPAVRENVVDFDGLVELGKILTTSLREGGESRVDSEGQDRLSSAYPPLKGSHLFCALGTTIRKAGSQEAFRRVDHDYPLALGHAARAGGAGFFGLVSSVGADAGARSFYLQVKGQLEEALRGLGLPSLAILRPSVIGGDRQESRPLETLGKWALSLIPGRYRTVHAGSIARCMVRLALEPQPGVRVVESEEIRRIAAD